jgi:hypothetical protein
MATQKTSRREGFGSYCYGLVRRRQETSPQRGDRPTTAAHNNLTCPFFSAGRERFRAPISHCR